MKPITPRNPLIGERVVMDYPRNSLLWFIVILDAIVNIRYNTVELSEP